MNSSIPNLTLSNSTFSIGRNQALNPNLTKPLEIKEILIYNIDLLDTYF
jgi:hypothetical protein